MGTSNTKPVPTHLYRPTVIEAKALAFMGESYAASRDRIISGYSMVKDDQSKRHFYQLGHTLYREAVRQARKLPNCPKDIAQPWTIQPWDEPVKGGQ